MVNAVIKVQLFCNLIGCGHGVETLSATHVISLTYPRPISDDILKSPNGSPSPETPEKVFQLFCLTYPSPTHPSPLLCQSISRTEGILSHPFASPIPLFDTESFYPSSVLLRLARLPIPTPVSLGHRTMVETDKILPPHSDETIEQVNTSWAGAIPVKQGLYDPELEKDACGVGFAWYASIPIHR